MISKAQIEQVLKVYRAGKVSKPVFRNTGAAQPVREDQIKLSFSAEDIEKVKRVVSACPDIREDIVKPIARKVEAGEYSVDPEIVAEKMLGRLLADRIR